MRTMLSMTGFGQGRTSGAAGVVTVQLSAVNNRAFAIHLRSELQDLHLDELIRQELRQALVRGAVTAHVAFQSAHVLAIDHQRLAQAWRELATLLGEIFTPASIANGLAEDPTPYDVGVPLPPKPTPSPHQKLVIFTEHRDTLNYLHARIRTLLGRPQAIVTIHGGMGREERLKAQEAFRHDPEVQVLLATDAAGEGINLQRAHLMVNYDLPWNPNRLEQRFGRIHRIGQTEVCHLWNLVAEETREGDVYRKLLEKLAQARNALGGQVFDVLGKLQFEGRPLRELLIDAIRYGDQPDVRARLTKVVENAFDKDALRTLLEDRALAHDSMDASRVYRIREGAAANKTAMHLFWYSIFYLFLLVALLVVEHGFGLIERWGL